MGRKLNLLRHPARSAGDAISDADLEAWAKTERDPQMREALLAFTKGTSDTSLYERPRSMLESLPSVLWFWLPAFIWVNQGFDNLRLLDAPLGYVGTLYHHVPGPLRVMMGFVPPILAGYVAYVLDTDTNGRRWPAVVLACYAFLSCWQLVPPAVTRWFGTPHVEIARVGKSLEMIEKDRLLPTRLVVARPGGGVESIDYYASPFAYYVAGADERRLGLTMERGDWVRLSGERTALGFFVHHVARADPPR